MPLLFPALSTFGNYHKVNYFIINKLLFVNYFLIDITSFPSKKRLSYLQFNFYYTKDLFTKK